MISLVVALGDNQVIGKDGWMPWNLPEDLKSFRKLTLHHAIVMGRTTFDAMKKPLLKRHTYVVTRNKAYTYNHEDVSVVYDFKRLLDEYKQKDEILYICGGAKVYEYALPWVDEMWISLVDEHYEGDTFFPRFNEDDFLIETKEKKEGFHLIHYIRKK
jgi:Dihydrofolate reductase